MLTMLGIAHLLCLIAFLEVAARAPENDEDGVNGGCSTIQ